MNSESSGKRGKGEAGGLGLSQPQPLANPSLGWTGGWHSSLAPNLQRNRSGKPTDGKFTNITYSSAIDLGSVCIVQSQTNISPPPAPEMGVPVTEAGRG